MDEVAESLRRADGALPRGRGDLPRGDRRRAQGRAPTTARSSPSPAASRRATSAPTACSTRSSRTCPRRSSTAASRSARSTLEPVEDKELFAYVFKTRADPFAGRINLFRVYQGVLKQDIAGAEHAHPHQGADRPAADVRGQADRARQRVRPRRHRRRREAQGDASAGDWLAARDEPIEMPSIKLPAPVMAFAVEPKSKGDEDKVFTVAAAPAGGGPDDRPAPRPADRRADRRRALAGPRRGDRRAAEVALRRRGQPEAAARPLPGDDPQAGQGARPPQEADRRPRSVRRLPHRDRAARGRRAGSSSSTRSRAA